MIREKPDQTEKAFYDWLSRVEEAGHASEDYVRGASDGFEGFDRGERTFGYVEGLRAGERWRERQKGGGM